MRRPCLAIALGIGLSAGCTDGMSAGSGDSSSTGAPPSVTTGTSSGGIDPSGSSGTSTAGGSSGIAETGVAFIETRDGGGSFECDIFEQDCLPGEKCMAWASEGGAWDSTRCVPIAKDAAGFGEPCQYEDGVGSGIDDCGAGLMCWYLQDGIGRCVQMCGGSADNPSCPEPDEVCTISGAGGIALCLTGCDPLAQDCTIENEGCYQVTEEWDCVPDASGEMGAYGDPCEYANACDPLHVCIGAEAFTSCAGLLGCCSQLCDVFDPSADAGCAALDPNQACEPWYREGAAPPGYEHVGVCAVPA